MAGFMDSINKGFATINVKTSNMVENSKLKAAMGNKEAEIAQLKASIGETLYVNRANFNMEMVQGYLDQIDTRKAEIEDIKAQIQKLEEKEKEVTGSNDQDMAPKIYCGKCGTPNNVGYKFCEKCGSPLEQ